LSPKAIIFGERGPSRSTGREGRSPLCGRGREPCESRSLSMYPRCRYFLSLIFSLPFESYSNRTPAAELETFFLHSSLVDGQGLPSNHISPSRGEKAMKSAPNRKSIMAYRLVIVILFSAVSFLVVNR